MEINRYWDSPEICKGVDDDSKDKVEDDDDDNEEEEDVVEDPDHEEGVFAGGLTQNITNPPSVPQTLKWQLSNVNGTKLNSQPKILKREIVSVTGPNPYPGPP